MTSSKPVRISRSFAGRSAGMRIRRSRLPIASDLHAPLHCHRLGSCPPHEVHEEVFGRVLARIAIRSGKGRAIGVDAEVLGL